jgi:hypothetical protein
VPNPPNPYEGCCGAEPVEFQLGENSIYIPNMFTPNGDGFNDLFRPFFNKEKISIKKMVIKSIGESPSILTLNEAELQEPLWGWFGYKTQDEVYKGKFLYEMTFADIKTGIQKTITGSACSAVCNGNEKILLQDVNKCFFPAQYDKNTVDKSFPLHLEVECLHP